MLLPSCLTSPVTPALGGPRAGRTAQEQRRLHLHERELEVAEGRGELPDERSKPMASSLLATAGGGEPGGSVTLPRSRVQHSSAPGPIVGGSSPARVGTAHALDHEGGSCARCARACRGVRVPARSTGAAGSAGTPSPSRPRWRGRTPPCSRARPRRGPAGADGVGRHEPRELRDPAHPLGRDVQDPRNRRRARVDRGGLRRIPGVRATLGPTWSPRTGSVSRATRRSSTWSAPSAARCRRPRPASTMWSPITTRASPT